MREIKFRAWDKFNAVYVYSGAEPFPTLAIFFIYVQRCENGGNPMVLEQFTGLKDNAGVDIYEGDILQPKDYPKNCAVAFENGAFVCHGGQIRIDPLDWWKRVIIGNIFENPELVGT